MIFVEADEKEEEVRKFYEKVYEYPHAVILENVWGPGDGSVFLLYKTDLSIKDTTAKIR